MAIQSLVALILRERVFIICVLLQDGDPIKFLTCLHRYHAGCIDPWLYMKGTCPVCLLSIDPEGSDAAEETPSRTRYAVNRPV